MNFLDALKLRYTTKRYDPSKGLDSATISDIAEILRLSPSSINSQPWRFILVTDPQIKSQLAAHSLFNKEKIEEAPLLVVCSVCNDLDSFEEQITRELPQPNVDYYNSVIKPQGEERAKSWLTHQLYISIGVLLSACAIMGLDSTPMEGLDPKMYDSILDNGVYHAVVAVAIGHRSISDRNQPSLTPKQRRDIGDVIILK